MTHRILCAAALACALGLAACGGGGGGGAPPSAQPTQPPGVMPPPAAGEPAAPLLTGLWFDYELTRAGEEPIEETGSVALSCPEAGCAAYDPRNLSGGDGTRGGFATATGATGGPPLTGAFSGATATAGETSFTRHGFWGVHGYAAVETGTGALTAEAGGLAWSGSFRAAHAWAGGVPSGTNPSGAGSATWRGIAEAARTATFERLPGTAELRIADLARPLVDVDVDLDDGAAGVALRWSGIEPAGGVFIKGAAGADRIEGRFHGPGHEEAWGVFDTGAYVGAFGAKRR